jgi:hypothetical protein
MVATLWNLSEGQATKTLLKFKQKALLLSSSSLADGTPTYRMHDLMHDLAMQLLQAPTEPKDLRDLPGLGLTKAEAHGQLLERYQAQTQENQWHTLPDDGYIYQHLTWHMQQAGQADAIHALLQETREDGRNAWYEACDFLGQPAQFVSDLGRAWQLAETSYAEQPTDSIVLQCRYGLIKTSLNTLALNISAELIAIFVKNGYWSAAQGLAYAQQAQEDATKAQIIQALALYLPKGLLPKTLELTREIQHAYFRASALSALSEKHPELYREALAATREIQHASSRAKALRALAEKHPELYGEALAATREIQNAYYRAEALRALAEKHPELYGEALAATREIQHAYSRAKALRALAEKLPPEWYGEALAATREIEDAYYRAKALRALAEKHPELYGEALAATREIQNASDRASVLRVLAEKHPELYGEALAATREIQNAYSRAEVLRVLAEKLPPEWYGEALAATREIQNASDRASVLRALAEKHPELYGEALAATREIEDASDRAKALLKLLRRMNGDDVDYNLWLKLHDTISSQTRKDNISCLALLEPAIVTLGGKEALRGVVETMRQVCRWWP